MVTVLPMNENSQIVCCCSLNKPTACPECLQSEFDPNPVNIDPDRECEVAADFNRIKSLCAVKIADFNLVLVGSPESCDLSQKAVIFSFATKF
jgi:hypothetical protein